MSNGTFHTMISQAGGGVAFYKSPQIWRINHYRFFHMPTDRSGFYTYIKDGETVLCPTNEPCREKPEKWSATHGMGYTRFLAEKNGINAVATYFVGEYENALIWNLKLKSNTNKKITIFPYVELGMMEFMRELQWQCYNKHQLLPMIAQQKAGEWRYKAEPYVYASNIFGPESEKFGLANVSWLTGTAAWMYVAVTQYMLGIKAKYDGLEINPCLPKEMLTAKVTRVFRGCKYEITITKNEKTFVSHIEGRKEYSITI